MASKLSLTIRATSGLPWETDRFNSNHHVHTVLKAALKHFIDVRAMAPGDYALALVVAGRAVELADSDKLEAAGVVNGAQLTLIVRGPQVDG